MYLLIFQQLGQLLRWSWGYNVLLAPAHRYSEEDGGTDTSARLEQGQPPHNPEDDPRQPLIGTVYEGEYDSDNASDEMTRVTDSSGTLSSDAISPTKHRSAFSSRSVSQTRNGIQHQVPESMPTPANGNTGSRRSGGNARGQQRGNHKYDEEISGVQAAVEKIKNQLISVKESIKAFLWSKSTAAFDRLPQSAQKLVSKSYGWLSCFMGGLWEFMNPPLWAMLFAIIVASVPSLQQLFFDDGTFIRNSVTRAIGQSGGVAVPLILVVLGGEPTLHVKALTSPDIWPAGNLARNTLPSDGGVDILDPYEERKLLIAALVSRMVLPIIIMAPILALVAKYVPVSIVDDKIFVIVCFLLTGAPTALQLAQICQVNNVYMSVMSKILFQSYVVWILPSTLILVMCALEVVEWATN